MVRPCSGRVRRPAFGRRSAPSASVEALVAALPGCACATRAELDARRERIAASPDRESARELALDDASKVRRALSWARRVAPDSPRLRDAEERLDVYAARVARAQDPHQVAGHFAALVEEADDEWIVGVDGDNAGGDFGSCHLSTRETIAVVLGLIFGIIPGLILLVLLCWLPRL